VTCWQDTFNRCSTSDWVHCPAIFSNIYYYPRCSASDWVWRTKPTTHTLLPYTVPPYPPTSTTTPGNSKEEVEKFPFVERLLEKGYEILYLTQAVDKYVISALPEFEGKKLQNMAYLTQAVDKYVISALPEFEGKKLQNMAYLTQAVDKYVISALPEFEGKKLQNMAKVARVMYAD